METHEEFDVVRDFARDLAAIVVSQAPRADARAAEEQAAWSSLR
jgi:hypothetical protein